MKETKRCPYCGEEILAVAKKCKYCGEWLDKDGNQPSSAANRCPVCDEVIPVDASVCPECGEPLTSVNVPVERVAPEHNLRNNNESAGFSRKVKISSSKSQMLPERSTDRKAWKVVLLSVITFGIYYLFVMAAMSKETNIACAEDGEKTRNFWGALLLSIITLGIYGYVWIFKWTNREYEYLRRHIRGGVLGGGAALCLSIAILVINIVSNMVAEAYWVLLTFLCFLSLFLMCKFVRQHNDVCKTYNGMPTKTEASSSVRNTWLPVIIASVLALGLSLYFILRPQTNVRSCFEDARPIHEWFFDNLGKQVDDLSDCPELKERVSVLLGKKLFSKVEDLMADQYMEDTPNLSVSHNESEADCYLLECYSFDGTKVESFVMDYTDYGSCGNLHIVTNIDGHRKEITEKLKVPDQISPIVYQYEYSGFWREDPTSDIAVSMTLWHDTSAEFGTLMRGLCFIDSDRINLSGNYDVKDSREIFLDFEGYANRLVFKNAVLGELLRGSMIAYGKNGEVTSTSVYVIPKGEDPIPQGTTATLKGSGNKEEKAVMRCISSLYREVALIYKNENDSFFSDREYLDAKYLSSSLKKAIADVEAYDEKKEVDVGFFDFDKYTMAQDFYAISISDLSAEVIDSSHASVLLNLHNIISITPMKLLLIKENGDWKIDNFIEEGEHKFDLKAKIKEYIKE